MPFPKWLGALVLVGALSSGVQAQERLRVMAVMDHSGFLDALSTQLNDAHRYWVEVKKQPLRLEGALTAERLKALKGSYPARLVVFGTVASGSAQLQLLDLELGDLVGPLFLQGDPQAISKAFVKYLKGRYPLVSQVSSVRGNTLLLDLGAQQGIKAGMVFCVRHTKNPSVLPLARVEVVSLDEWVSSARVREISKDQSIQPGDYLTEDPADSLLR